MHRWVTVMTIPDGMMHTYYVDMSKHPEWRGNGINVSAN
jgi:hypothetical protein